MNVSVTASKSTTGKDTASLSVQFATMTDDEYSNVKEMLKKYFEIEI